MRRVAVVRNTHTCLGRPKIMSGSTPSVVVVGGGPAGCATGVFTARYGLETTILDRGSSSLRRAAFVENYLGFPAGIDPETFYDLAHDHAREAGCDLVEDMVVEVTDASEGFRVETQDDRVLDADFVVAATKYDWQYLDALPVDFVDDGEYEQFDSSLVEQDGATPLDGLYVAGPNAGVPDQVLVAAGHGAHVGRAIIADVRRADGYEGTFAEHYDWLRREENLTGEWATRERWQEYLDDAPDAPDDDELRERYIDDRFAKYLDEDEREERKRNAHRRLADHLDLGEELTD
ncbi:FAD-dependent oxidoreductase [Salarchaeum japonicum]|uniref:FAD-dependent oxidoreductase n=1 Tax=Salarchaeum japonicum TaxID=555573 RepID=UPI0038733FF7